MKISSFVRRACAAAALAATAGLLVLSAPAEARGYVSFGVGLGGWPGYYYGPPAYYAPPAYYPPAYYPPAYEPAPFYDPPPVSYREPPPQQACREYQSTATIDGRPQQLYGTACQQPDGSWKLTR